jgi:hypothetical protein
MSCLKFCRTKFEIVSNYFLNITSLRILINTIVLFGLNIFFNFNVHDELLYNPEPFFFIFNSLKISGTGTERDSEIL